MIVHTPAPRLKWSRYALLLGYICGGMWAVWIGLAAIIEAFNLDDLPDLLAITAERLPAVFPIHMVSSGLTLVFLPLTIALRRWPRWHRMSGRLTSLCVVIGAVTALIVAVYSISPMLARVGFFAQGLIWITLLSAGLVMARRRRTSGHRRLMLMMTAVTSGAVLFRLALAGFVFCLPWADYKPFYSAIAWLGWMLPFAVAAWVTRSQVDRAARQFQDL